jgi:hypothetical protein
MESHLINGRLVEGLGIDDIRQFQTEQKHSEFSSHSSLAEPVNLGSNHHIASSKVITNFHNHVDIAVKELIEYYGREACHRYAAKGFDIIEDEFVLVLSEVLDGEIKTKANKHPKSMKQVKVQKALRGTSGYNFFVRSYRETAGKKLEKEQIELKGRELQREIMKKCGEKWKSLGMYRIYMSYFLLPSKGKVV